MDEESLKEIRALAEYNKPHYRILYRLKTRETFVACLQAFDYMDYKECGAVDDVKYETEQEAEDARSVSHFYGHGIPLNP